ncbi:amino acid adenylation domain-containing protein [Streptomyces tsukubensis]|uniref:non-ribosomal peptide synthetase n=1 Tax=Streptomyces tsukubensis TaxID=83656 RepID=UPI0036C205DA
MTGAIVGSADADPPGPPGPSVQPVLFDHAPDRPRTEEAGEYSGGESGSSPLTPAQKYFRQLDRANRRDTGNPPLTVRVAVRLTDPPGRDIVRRALARLAARHTALRARYPVEDGHPVQVIVPDFEPPLDTMRVLPAELTAALARHDEPGFDLAEEPPWRALYVEVEGAPSWLLLTLHPIVCDPRSARTLRRDLRELVASGIARRAPHLPALHLDHRDLTALGRKRRTGAEWEERLKRYCSELAGLSPLELSARPGHARRRDLRGRTFRFRLPSDPAAALAHIGERHGATRHETFLAAFVALLARYTGRTRFAVGTQDSGRTGDGTDDDVVGCFANVLVLRCDTGPDPAFGRLLERTIETVRVARESRDVPYEWLARRFAPDGDPVQHPLVQVRFDAHDEDATDRTDGTPHEDTAPATPCPTDVDLRLTVEFHDDGSCTGEVSYATETFDEAKARRLAGHFVRLVTAVAADPRIRLSDVDILTPEEWSTVVTEWNRLTAPRSEQAVHEMIAEHALRTPDAVALTDAASSMTFAELEERIARLAARLRTLGVRPEQVVAVCLNRGPDLVAALLAVWRAGGAYLPLDPVFPRARLGHTLSDAGAGLVITERACLTALPEERSTRYLVLDAPGEQRAVAREQPLAQGPVDPDRLAYIMYTSGSTGQPKGVLVSHRGLQNYLMWTVERYVRPGGRGTPLFSSIAFDMVVPDLYTALMVGQPVHLLPEGFDPGSLGGLLSAAGPFSFVKLTPGHLDLLTEQLTPAQAGGLAGLLAVGADSFPSTVLDRWLALAGPDGPALLNEYGPTEISVANSTHTISGPQAPGVLPIGRPIPNTTAYVLSGHGLPQPVGVPGELCIGGIGLARGYRNKPVATAEKFVPDPFSGRPGARLYRTGDRARFRTDGTIEFLGRSDDQIKIRGYRIEPGEVAAALMSHPGVLEAVVVPRGTGDDARLVGYVVPDLAEHADQRELRRHCGELLPAYMVPADLVELDRIPLNANGKVDRSALPAPDGPGDRAAEDAPAGELEERMESLWRTLLASERPIGVTRSFFELGGNSILGSRLMARITAEFAVTLPLRAVFEQPTIRALARRVETEARREISGLADAEVVALTLPERGGRG